MSKSSQYLRVISIHKWYVFVACLRCGLVRRGLTHDLSKLSPTEFIEYVKYFEPGKSPVDVCKDKNGFSKSWQHHKGTNTHHWQYWVDFDSQARAFALRIPYDDMIGMICDWIGAGKSYGGSKWNNSSPFTYFKENEHRMIFHRDTYGFIYTALSDIEKVGWGVVSKRLKKKDFYNY